jgi:hypothetical protein
VWYIALVWNRPFSEGRRIAWSLGLFIGHVLVLPAAWLLLVWRPRE